MYQSSSRTGRMHKKPVESASRAALCGSVHWTPIICCFIYRVQSRPLTGLSYPLVSQLCVRCWRPNPCVWSQIVSMFMTGPPRSCHTGSSRYEFGPVGQLEGCRGLTCCTHLLETCIQPGGGRLYGSQDANYPPPPPRGLRPTVSCQRCRPQASMGAKSARRFMNTKGALRKILSTSHPNTILKPNLDSNAHPQPSAYS